MKDKECKELNCQHYDEEFGCAMPIYDLCFACKKYEQPPKRELLQACIECEFFDDTHGCTIGYPCGE